MAITLTDGTTTVALNPDLYWSDENSWHPVEQTVQRTVTGAVVVSTASRLKGRGITLTPQGDNSAWMSRATLDVLRNWGAVPGAVLTLTLRGINYSVIFRHHDSPAIDATPIVHYQDVDTADWYSITLKFMEV